MYHFQRNIPMPRKVGSERNIIKQFVSQLKTSKCIATVTLFPD